MVGKGIKALIAIVVVVVVQLGIGWGVYRTMVEHTNEMIKKSCTPALWDRNGKPTLWKCPVSAGGGE